MSKNTIKNRMLKVGMLSILAFSTSYVSKAAETVDFMLLNSGNVEDVRNDILKNCSGVESCEVNTNNVIDVLRESLLRSESTTAERDEAIQLSQTLANSLNKLNERYNKVLDSLRSQKNKLRDLKNKLADMNDAEAQLKNKLAASDLKVNNLSEQLAGLNDQIAKLFDTLDGLEKDKLALEAQINKLDDEIARLKAQLNEKDKALTLANAKIDSLTADKQKLEKSVADKTAEIVKKDNEIDNLKAAANMLEREKLALNEAIAKAKDLNAALDAQLTQSKQTIDGLKDNLQQAEAQAKKLKATIVDKDKQIDGLSNEKRLLLQQIADAKKQLADLKQQISVLNNEVADLKANIAKLEANEAALRKQFAGDKRKLENEISALKLKVEQGEEAKAMLDSIVGDLSKITVADLIPVSISKVNPQEWLINNVYLHYLRYKKIDRLATLGRSSIATAGVETIQTQMNQWMVDKGFSLSSLNIPRHRRECKDLLCADGIVGLRTRMVALKIDEIDPDFWPGSFRK